ncbi:MAG: sigma 54-interacting transcriptional regulator [Spirochaetales bacterium]|nr:sigma 54-interacting transcriptional regulator [Spirochaetales bacterium]
MQAASIDVERLETLIEINTLINSNYTDDKALLTHILESASRLAYGESSSLLLLDHETDRLYFEISLGPKGTEVQKFSLKMGEGIAGWVAKHNTSLIVNDVEKDERHQKRIDTKTGYATTSMLAVPMRIKDRCVGVIEIINRLDKKNFTNDDLLWLERFAVQAALAIQNARSYKQLRDEVILLQDKINVDKGYHPFISGSKIIEEKLELVKKIAGTNSSVLILGESGVGKELFAEQIHLNSKRSDGPFIRVNCAALPEHLLESELFGHVKGAFTDATSDRRGRFELANGGTIFLDEIGDLPFNLQSKLLRVVQHMIFEKVGASEPTKVDVRVLAATNKDIEQAIEDGKFRKDLYYRLNVLPFYIPPLRERVDDIPILAEFFLRKFNHELKRKITDISSAALDALMSYSWPGNVRELENVIERSAVICDDDVIRPQHLLLVNNFNENDEYENKKLKDALNTFKKHFIRKALEQNGWNQTETARTLGIQRTYLSRLIKELDMNNK